MDPTSAAEEAGVRSTAGGSPSAFGVDLGSFDPTDSGSAALDTGAVDSSLDESIGDAMASITSGALAPPFSRNVHARNTHAATATLAATSRRERFDAGLAVVGMRVRVL